MRLRIRTNERSNVMRQEQIPIGGSSRGIIPGFTKPPLIYAAERRIVLPKLALSNMRQAPTLLGGPHPVYIHTRTSTATKFNTSNRHQRHTTITLLWNTSRLVVYVSVSRCAIPSPPLSPFAFPIHF